MVSSRNLDERDNDTKQIVFFIVHILRGTRNLSFLTYIKCIIFLFLP